jgi:hypothetical protein
MHEVEGLPARAGPVRWVERPPRAWAQSLGPSTGSSSLLSAAQAAESVH